MTTMNFPDDIFETSSLFNVIDFFPMLPMTMKLMLPRSNIAPRSNDTTNKKKGGQQTLDNIFWTPFFVFSMPLTFFHHLHQQKQKCHYGIMMHQGELMCSGEMRRTTKCHIQGHLNPFIIFNAIDFFLLPPITTK